MWRIVLLIVSAVFAAPNLQVCAEQPSLIPRKVLFGNLVKASPRISPDGKRLAYLAPDKNNVLQVWVQTIGKDDARQVTSDKKRGIRVHHWTYDANALLYLQDNDGDENFHVYSVNLASDKVRDLTPYRGARADIQGLHRDKSRSPLFKADRIKIPMMIAQGANDPRVKQAESEQVVEAIKKAGKPVEYLLFKDEGHGFAQPENRMIFFAAAEAFLAKYLGGRCEPAKAQH